VFARRSKFLSLFFCSELATQAIMTDQKKLVAKDNAFVAQARYRLSVNEQRVILTLISKINPESDDFERYTFEIVELFKLLGLKRESLLVKQRAIKKVLKSLQRNIIEITKRSAEHGGEILLMPAWIETPVFDWNKGIVSLRVSEHLKPYLLDLKEKFTCYCLSEVAHLKCSYSFRFLEFCKNHEPRPDYYDLILNNRYVVSKIHDLKNLRLVLGIPEKVYPRVSDFRKRVLETSQKEINTKTSSYFEFEMIKKGRFVSGVKLLIFGRTVENQEQSENPAPSLSKPDAGEQALRRRMAKLGVSNYFQDSFLRFYTWGKIKIALEVIDEYQQKIKYPTGLLNAALREEWMSNKEFARQLSEQKTADQIEALNESKSLADGLEKHLAQREKELQEQSDLNMLRYEEQLAQECLEYEAVADKTAYIISVLPECDYGKLDAGQRLVLKLALDEQIFGDFDFDRLKHCAVINVLNLLANLKMVSPERA
jgi:plasmid replication initiation protein